MKEQNIVLIRDANISFGPILDLLILDNITNLTAFHYLLFWHLAGIFCLLMLNL